MHRHLGRNNPSILLNLNFIQTDHLDFSTRKYLMFRELSPTVFNPGLVVLKMHFEVIKTYTHVSYDYLADLYEVSSGFPLTIFLLSAPCYR